uniref:Uncharacterized protein n=1 Tax=uncultured bacterium A1Q1_fos_660 TaxID=1256588 RepID=L7VU57_9BACT|nr:hypothetical protein [uncultured bacterium A1Q1_fos_660]
MCWDALPLWVRQEDRTSLDQRGCTALGSGPGRERSPIPDPFDMASRRMRVALLASLWSRALVPLDRSLIEQPCLSSVAT